MAVGYFLAPHYTSYVAYMKQMEQNWWRIRQTHQQFFKKPLKNIKSPKHPSKIVLRTKKHRIHKYQNTPRINSLFLVFSEGKLVISPIIDLENLTILLLTTLFFVLFKGKRIILLFIKKSKCQEYPCPTNNFLTKPRGKTVVLLFIRK